MMSRKLILAAILTCCLGCGTEPAANEPKDHSFGSRLNLVPELGTGYHSQAAIFTGNKCIEQGAQDIAVWARTDKRIVIPSADESLSITAPKLIETGDAQIAFRRNLSYQEMMRGLDIGLELKVRVHPAIQLRGEVNYANENASSILDETLTVNAKFTKLKRSLSNPTLSQSFFETVALRRENAANRDRPSASALCGDEFVDSVSKGISLTATLAIKFDNSYDKTLVNGKLGVTLLDFININAATLNTEEKNIIQRTRVTLSMMQQGGRPEELLAEIPDGGSVSEQRGVVSCTLQNVRPCYEAYQRLIGYIERLADSSQFDEEALFPLQFTSKSFKAVAFPELYKGSSSADAEILRRFYQTPQAFIQELQAGIDSNIDQDQLKQDRANLLIQIESIRNELRTAEALVAREQVPDLSEQAEPLAKARHEDELRRYRQYVETFENLKFNFDLYSKAYQECFSHPERCHDAKNDANTRKRLINSGLLSVSPKNFAGWCMQYNNAEGDGQDRLTVRALLTFAAGAYGLPSTSCDAIGLKLREETYIKVHATERIRSLRPLTSLPRLRRLDVSGNTVIDISPLQEMPALQEVDLSGNQIEDISPLQYTNSRLRDINLDGNRILTPGYSLQRPVPLRRLYLQNNEISVDHEYFKGLTEHLYLFGNPLSENVNCDRCYTKKYQFNF